MLITPPKHVKSVLKKLEISGYKAFLVGGCVRDMLMGRPPQDWDICTNALPEEVLSAFPGAVGTGIKHGTVTVFADGHGLEVTTFRTEGGYLDHRRPGEVNFIGELMDDLERRDFTINAMAVSLAGIVHDPFNGAADAARGIIRCVGDPDRRFGEDALRMLRAIRFAARLDFEIESETAAAIGRNAHLTRFLSPERVHKELERILMSPKPAAVGQLLTLNLIDGYLDRSGLSLDFSPLEQAPKNRLQRWAAFCALLESGTAIADTESFLRALRLDGATIRHCSEAVRVALDAPAAEKLVWKRVLSYQGVETAHCAAVAADALSGGGHLKIVKSIMKSNDCFSAYRLAVRGEDILALGFAGPEIGRVLRSLLDHVLEHPADNSKPVLISLALKKRAHLPIAESNVRPSRT